MNIDKDLRKRITKKFGSVLDLKKKPELLQELLDELEKALNEKSPVARDVPLASPFGVSWMDSWVGTWIVADKLTNAKARDTELAAVLQGLVDAKFNQRIAELRRFVREYPNFAGPDGGTPEPGVPPVGPAGFVFEPPDGGPPEPGVPPVGPAGFVFEPPDGGPPEPGTPEPPDPGPSGHGAGLLRDNPWILLWFVSLQAPMIIDMIDAHFTRRMNDFGGP